MLAQRSGGFSLIEVLVSLVIISIGLLGAASLQLNALQASTASHERTLASGQVDSFFEGLWANACHAWEGDGENRHLSPEVVTKIHTDWFESAQDQLERLESVESSVQQGAQGLVSVELNWVTSTMMSESEDPVTARVIHTKRILDPRGACS
ncbi:type IV pilus modification protein PilV [Thioalkalivibrio sp. ALE16]|uniref:type IV pilus modification protein PilV n=1 Tax=Thioalkalivibrio sp. ALE16 TaxID=1158172 RepID=UPI0003644DB0|nr:type IV pilus modification protein PilV [Thioalkalivibrio sp. ALE16]